MDILNRVQKLESDLEFEREERGTAVMLLFDYFRSKLESVQEGLPVPEPKEELECKLRWNGLHDTDFRMEEVKSPPYCCKSFGWCFGKGIFSLDDSGWYCITSSVDKTRIRGETSRNYLKECPFCGKQLT